MHRPCRSTALVLICALAGCASPTIPDRAEEDTGTETKAESGHAALARAVELAKQQLAQVELANRAAQEASAAEIAAAETELAAATRALSIHVDRAAPLARSTAELELRGQETQVHEVEEELSQLKLMYAEQDLADQTREMVIARSERRLAQARAELDIARRALALLVEAEQPAENEALAATVAEKERALATARRDARVEWNAKQIERLQAEHALLDAQEALAEAATDES